MLFQELSLLILLSCPHLSSSQSLKAVGSPVVLRLRDGCETNSSWQATEVAWSVAKTDEKLESWWKNLSSKSHQSFAKELGRGFGDHLNGFECGIGAYSTCIAPGCAEYDKNSDPPWAYLALLAVVSLNQFFNSIFAGISNGQSNFVALTNDLANNFFSWKEPKFILGDVAIWIVAIVTAIFAIPAGMVGVGAGTAAAAVALGAFVGAGVQQISNSFEPSVTASQVTKSEGLAKLGQFAAQIGSTSRESVKTWANATMHGEEDALGKSILDYINSGSFVAGHDTPTSSEIERFYTKQMVSRTINSQWRKEKVFITFFQTDDSNDNSGPNATKYYSAKDRGVYYLYRYTETGVLSGRLDKPWGLDYLNTSTYSILGNEITKASALAFRTAGFNYSSDIAHKRTLASMSSNGTLTPFKDGASWEGTWTITVCDMGSNNWNSQFHDNATRYGMLPCCCGPNCNATQAFVEAANLKNFQTLLRGCKTQLQNTPLKFEDIDYGFSWRNSFVFAWALWSEGQRAGVVIGILFAVGLLVVLGGDCCCKKKEGGGRGERDIPHWELYPETEEQIARNRIIDMHHM